MNKDNLLLALIIINLLIVSFLNNIAILFTWFIGIIGVYLVFRGSLHALTTTFKRISIFCIVLSVAYYIHAILKGLEPLGYILMFNLRIFNMVTMVLYFSEFVHPIRAFSFSKTLSYMFALTYSQIQLYIKLYREFNLVMKSRMIQLSTYTHRLFFFSKMVEYFFNKAVIRSENTAMAMRSRGFFLND